MSEVIDKEVAAFGIKVTAIAPGSFRTDWAGRSMARSPRTISDYDAPFDPEKAARLVMDLIAMGEPPVHLLLGSDALHPVEPALQAKLAGIEAHRAPTRSTDFDR